MPPAFTPSLISWNLTRRCNLRCPHCYLSAGEAEADELSTDECLALLDELAALGTEMLILTGGEPLLRRDIYEIARKASALGMWVVMGTNGVLVNDHVARKMVDCGVRGVGISLDALDPEKHDRFRGGPDAWKHSVRALEICRRHGLEVLVQTTVMEMNYDEIPALLDFAREKGAWSFNVYFLVQTGRGQALNDLSPERTEALLTRLVELQDRYRPMLVRAKCAPQFKQIAYAMGRGGLESGGCMAGTAYCRITPGGDVTPCPYMTVVAGNLRERSFTEIWQTSPVFADLRDRSRLQGRCGACEFNALCGGCRCRAYAATGDYLAEDPACTYRPTGRPLAEPPLDWSDNARARLERIPIAFIRDKVRRGVEAFARRHGLPRITHDVMTRALQGADRPEAFAGLKAPAFRPRQPAETAGTGRPEPGARP
ncbi:radical SAM protein [Rhodocaloribacter litoris]|uniref:radical SAM/SPASM domain-containing protein n=1 Tax=Rhodocaloribacter litoris TaxID=2558931 RepID=UPI0014217906|nr:radical SAM protein [Rhodocaloribacter litoris]QXD15938.1 radical SAM protein [Rhodocaloribacter litoris]